MLPPPFVLSTEKKTKSTFANPLPFETEPHTIHIVHWKENIVTLIYITFDIKDLK